MCQVAKQRVFSLCRQYHITTLIVFHCSNTAISKKVAPVIHDAWSMFHSPRCTMVDSYVASNDNK